MTTTAEAPKPKPSYEPVIIQLARKHGLDPAMVKQMVDQGLLKTD